MSKTSSFEINGFNVQIVKVEGEFEATAYRQGVFETGQNGFESYESAVKWITEEIEGNDIQPLLG